MLAPFCPTCNRELARKGDAKEVIKGLEEQTRANPAKVCSLKAKVALQRGWLEALRSICPARPPDAEAAGAGGAGGKGEDESD